MRTAIFSLSLLLFAGCVNVPRYCRTLLPKGKEASYFSGKCRKLVHRDQDLAAICRTEAVLYDADNETRTMTFFGENPQEMLAFSGKPFSVDPQSLRFDVHHLLRAPRRVFGSLKEGEPVKGSCDFVARDAKSYLIQCQAKDEKGKNSEAEFATSEARPIICRDDFPAPSKSPL